jgi:alcohol dehydrogenase
MHLPELVEFVNPVKTLCGRRALEHLPFELQSLGACKPLVIRSDDAASRDRLRLLARVLGQAGLSLGDAAGTPGHPGPSDVQDLAAIYRDKDCDAVLVLGQGALVDLAKLVNLTVSAGALDIAELDTGGRGLAGLRPLGVIPTGVPTGDETTGSAALAGKTFRGPRLAPRLWVLDPRVLGDDDAATTADCFWTTVTHAAEAMLGPGANALNSSCAAAALKLAAAYGPAGIEGRATPEDRLWLANGAGLAGVAFDNAPAGLAHRLAVALAPEARQPAGRLMGVLLPHVLEDAMHSGDDHVAGLLQPLAGIAVHAATPQDQRASQVVARLRQLLVRFYLATGGRTPRTLEDAGLAPAALETAVPGGPVAEAPEERFREILAAAWGGRGGDPSPRRHP